MRPALSHARNLSALLLYLFRTMASRQFTSFIPSRQRVEFLFALYEKLTAPLLPDTPKTKSRRSSRDGGTTTTPRPRKQRTPGLPGQTPIPG